MAIPVQFQQFKSAGIYRVVYDKSTVLGTDAELLRLVVGYSPKGPFNTPVYIKSVSDFKTMYGDISKSLEKRGCFFHRTCIQALESGPIICLNLKKFQTESVGILRVGEDFGADFIDVKNIYDRTRFWVLEPDNLNNNTNYLTISSVDSAETSNSVFIRKADNNLVKEYNISVADWYKSYGEDIPDYLVGSEDKNISDFFAEVFVFGGKFTPEQIIASNSLRKYFANSYYTEYNGEVTDTTVRNVPTVKMTNDTIVEGETGSFVSSSCVEIGGVFYGIPERIEVIPTTFTLDGDAYAVQSSKIVYVSESSITGKEPGFYLTETLTLNENKYVVNEKSVSADFALGIGSDNLMYAANQVVQVGNKFYATNSVVYTTSAGQTGTETTPVNIINNDGKTVSVYLYKPSTKANVGDPILGGWTVTQDPETGNVTVDMVAGTGGEIIVIDKIENAFGDLVDGLSALYADSASGAVAHYVGCLLPNFIDNNSGYKSLDILFNLDSDLHHMMMSFDDNMLSLSENAIAEVVLENAALKNDIDNRKPYFLQGYTYEMSKPTGTSIAAKLTWQNELISVLKEEVGIRKALLSNAEIDYRYIVDSFETYYSFNSEIKSELSLLAKEKELCFAILNFPSVSSLIKTNREIFTTNKGIFSVNKVVENVTLPSEANGASFCAFYTPLKFSDGYVDTIVPSAGLVSNLFINKYASRTPYSIIAGPNYGNITYRQLVGPDYHYSQEELHVIEPYGVNCMVYRPTFGTFINANQTAKQTPKSALSAINVRELVIYLQSEIGKVLQSYQWEFNNPTTRAAIKSKADLICETARVNGGIQRYLNVMDESNNTPDIIDNEMCVLSTSIEPGRGAGKMIHELTIYRTGGMSAMIKE